LNDAIEKKKLTNRKRTKNKNKDWYSNIPKQGNCPEIISKEKKR
jgi:hypothetical protein